ncbi:hypothetical protein I6U48_04000 [Clostridium sp. PL3]|uniref:Uncharacterized protein n=1 Tax=Clostridium thailandense TaxID=2794346 RepID=A0A949TFY4_9CLOT|nr:hypothetical protein [Clostridium thailandense]MBV7272079.1 hypothetical protein [Clostridium thailandense]
MHIDNYYTFSQSRSLSSAKKIGNVPSPNYTDFNFNTKKAPAMSDEKYREAIIEQAKKDQSAGKFQSESAGFRSLVKSYVSTVSPDRKNIITEGLTAIFKNKNPQPKTLNLVDYLFGNVKYRKEATDVSYAEFYDSNGEMVASYSNGKWISYGTKAENARESELWGIYNKAWNNAARASQRNSNVASIDATIGSIDKSV